MFYSRHLDSESRPTLILCTTTMKDRLFLRLSELIGWSEMVYPQAAVLEAPLNSMSCTPNNIVHSSTHTKAWLNEICKTWSVYIAEKHHHSFPEKDLLSVRFVNVKFHKIESGKLNYAKPVYIPWSPDPLSSL